MQQLCLNGHVAGDHVGGGREQDREDEHDGDGENGPSTRGTPCRDEQRDGECDLERTEVPGGVRAAAPVIAEEQRWDRVRDDRHGRYCE